MVTTTVLTAGTHVIDADLTDRRVVVDAAELPDLVGWTLKPEGLCRDDVCVPVADRKALEPADGQVDLVAVAELLGRPTVLDQPRATLVVGEPASARRQALRDRIAPDFTLPDLDGRPRHLSEWADKKKLLVAFSSW